MLGMEWTPAIPTPRFTPGYDMVWDTFLTPTRLEVQTGRRVELVGARRRRPKRTRGIWGRGIQASRATTLLKFRGNATPCSPSSHTRRPQQSHGKTRAPKQADRRYAKCPHPDCYPMASADLAELHRGCKPSLAQGTDGLPAIHGTFP